MILKNWTQSMSDIEGKVAEVGEKVTVNVEYHGHGDTGVVEWDVTVTGGNLDEHLATFKEEDEEKAIKTAKELEDRLEELDLV